MRLEIITPDRQVFAGEVSSAIFPGADGQFEVLNNHAPLISALQAGEVRVTSAAGRESFQVTGGVVEVLRNNVVVLAESVLA
ncbi:ATP synthase F1 subunit epsilon [Hymenobacter busanensis]|uniref:ATP synthase F1 subunit epsilon n=1 Tax=Hymenobacter busanensis TaxID=2607656 RepID=A0A7L5A173_9BACT|nr:ATP synthase F1 subunit epsilon [Hymenobacter busanensis]KAA9332192.1 ATP synthase F1 subunit epsilon [Hymenobacter busanensis]QHJ07470.1 ATP synthase F1 subunit epsilon [Hymenobacter busanensis]